MACPKPDPIANIRAAARLIIAKCLPNVLARGSVDAVLGSLVMMFRGVLRAVLQEVGSVAPADHGRALRIAGAVLMGELAGCGMCPRDEYKALALSLDALGTGRLPETDTLAWQLHDAAQRAFLQTWAANDKTAPAVSLESLELAFCPPSEESDIDRLELTAAFRERSGWSIKGIAKAVGVSRSAFYSGWLNNDWSEADLRCKRIRSFFGQFDKNLDTLKAKRP